MDKDNYKSVLLLKNQLETYVYGPQFEVQLTFSFFLNEYIRRQKLTDREFAVDIGASDAAISQYINNRRKPTREFLIRLELHSGGLFPALSWLKLLHKEKEYEIMTDVELREGQTIYVKRKMDFAGT